MSATYTAFQFFKDAGINLIALFEQHRTYHSRYVKWLSDHYYNGAIVDGTKGKAILP
jgi:hypothetical protein